MPISLSQECSCKVHNVFLHAQVGNWEESAKKAAKEPDHKGKGKESFRQIFTSQADSKQGTPRKSNTVHTTGHTREQNSGIWLNARKTMQSSVHIVNL